MLEPALDLVAGAAFALELGLELRHARFGVPKRVLEQCKSLAGQVPRVSHKVTSRLERSCCAKRNRFVRCKHVYSVTF